MRAMPVGILAAMTIPAAALADVVTLSPSRDNSIYEHPLGLLSNGAGPGLFAGRTNQGLIRRALLRFDVAGAVPAGSTITSVTLSLNLSRSNSGNVECGLHRLLVDWGEGTSVAPGEGGRGTTPSAGDATWLHTFFDASFWSSPGGQPGVDFAQTPSGTATIGAAMMPYQWSSTPGLVADVQSWLNAPGTNFGWMLVGGESALGTAKRFDSREHPEPSQRPTLTITYSPPCYANCDGSTGSPLLTANDFQCFLNKFAAGASYANCDGSTGTPALTANDFQCFLNKFAAGCS
jgi:hypothetical protein